MKTCLALAVKNFWILSKMTGNDFKSICTLIIWFIATVSCQHCSKPSQKEEDYYKSFDNLFSKNYLTIRPNITGGLTVEVGIHFVKLDGIESKEETFNSDLFIRMKWKDTRLCHNETDDIVLAGAHGKKFWTPDLYIENALKTTKHEITKLNQYIKISKNGDLLLSMRATVVAKCTQNLMYFPLDNQHCKMLISSYSYIKKQITLKWMKKNAMSIPHTEITQFIIRQTELEESDVVFSTGIFSQLVIHIKMQRRVGFYVITIYVPCVLIVILSWLSFWMNPEEIGDRISLGITCVLTLVFLMESTNSSLPKVSYAKAIDYYLIGCFLYVFTVVIQTVIAKQLSKCDRIDDDSKKQEDSYIISNTAETLAKNCWGLIVGKPSQDFVTGENDLTMKETIEEPVKLVKPMKKRNIDSYCRVLFPLLFAILNLCYWLVCMAKR